MQCEERTDIWKAELIRTELSLWNDAQILQLSNEGMVVSSNEIKQCMKKSNSEIEDDQ